VDRDFGREVCLALVDAESGAVVDPKGVVHVPGAGFLTRSDVDQDGE
jgi:hypothetical protein